MRQQPQGHPGASQGSRGSKAATSAAGEPLKEETPTDQRPAQAPSNAEEAQDPWAQVALEVDGDLAAPLQQELGKDGQPLTGEQREALAVLQAAKQLKARQLSFEQFRKSALAGLRDAARKVQLAQRKIEDQRFALTGAAASTGLTPQSAHGA